jgi:DNA-binding CsgD family transcriptional regulator
MEGILEFLFHQLNDIRPIKGTPEAILLQKKAAILQIFKPISCGLALFDTKTHQYQMLKWPYASIFKLAEELTDVASLYKLIHPDDYNRIVRAKTDTLKKCKTATTTDMLEYMLEYKCRLRDTEEKYRQMLHQYWVFETNEKGYPGLILMILQLIDSAEDESVNNEVKLIDMREVQPTDITAGDLLSSAERKVLRLADEGLTADEIGTQLKRSPHTVYKHLSNIRKRLGVNSTQKAIALTRSMGIL